MTTVEGDYVLDSFLGSGTTAAVAQKMNRKWIGIEMGEHAYSHCKVRLDRVIDGEDTGGITKDEKWEGGGGYHFYELAPSLLVKNDKLPIYQINPSYTFEMLTNDRWGLFATIPRRFGAGAVPFADGTKIDLGASGTLRLDYSGEATVKELWANGRQCQAGTYSATSGHLVSPRISGTGALVVLEGKASGTLLLVR